MLRPINSIGLIEGNSSYNGVTADSFITLRTVTGFFYNFAMMFFGCTITSLVRYICENAQSYDEAVKIAKSSWLIAPTYITITGTKLNEGVILTRDRLKCIHQNKLNKNKPFVVQCNSDAWTIDQLNSHSDIYDSKERHQMADRMLPRLLNNSNSKKQNKQKTNIVDLEYRNKPFAQNQKKLISKCWQFLSMYPIRNEETVYANIIVPAHGLILSGITKQKFVPVSAQEFRDMFYITSLS